MSYNYKFVGLMCSLFVLLPLAIVLIPMVLVDFQQGGIKVDAFAPEHNNNLADDSKIYINVKLSVEKKTVRLPLEDYIRGVVASEMPVEFEPESLRAQAIAARTYIYSRVKNKEATVTDTVKDQVYATDEKLKEKWGIYYQQNMIKVRAAVNSTKGKIITYQNKPIYAAFFSTSNGYTENSEEYFKEAYPYLRSVPSTWDRRSPKFMRSKTLPLSFVVKALEQHTGKKVSITAFSQSHPIILKRTSGKRIAQIKIGDHIFTGRDVREALGLASSDFSWRQAGGHITFITHGFGHGVGMSQWGANLMAKQGKSAEQIIYHYYQHVKIKNITN
ncbi:stage II sporulation protein D [Shimazuella sp. AN120528]|uniref:stage II sporulation protein D n=1 Tax=Shimazuella soli TaxID=1892854 RepID=UPI001F0EA426|nr:stage II sporulation protein D [Shimazuella soli]MCH5585263.1 stage II sporulation protein D [Shimazuella soli]